MHTEIRCSSGQKVKCVYFEWEDYSTPGEAVGNIHTHTHTHTHPNSIVMARKWAKLISSQAPDENQSGVADSPAADSPAADLCKRGPGQNENRSLCHHAASLISQAAGREVRDESRLTVTTGESQRCAGQKKKHNPLATLSPPAEPVSWSLLKPTTCEVASKWMQTRDCADTFLLVSLVPTKMEMTNASGDI